MKRVLLDVRLAALCAATWLGAGAAAAPPLGLAVPQPGQTVHSNSGDVAVLVVGAAPGARLQALLDGRPAGAPRESARFGLQGVARGSHHLRVAVVDEQGRELASTAEVAFTLWRGSAGPPAGPLPAPLGGAKPGRP